MTGAPLSPQSPCIKVCRLDASGRVCLGCHRTTEEIMRWPALDDDQKREVLANARGRQQDLGDQFTTRSERWRRW